MIDRSPFICLASVLRECQLRFLEMFILALLIAMQTTLLAGSATWDLSPTSNDWNTAANWTPATVPDEEADVATFGVSDVTNISVSTSTILGGITFDSGASIYTIVADFSIRGVGITNNSGVTQQFDSSPGVGFDGNATAGSGVVYTDNGIAPDGFDISFNDNSQAGSATFINKGDSLGLYGAYMVFSGQASAANSTIMNEPGDTYGARTDFYDDSSAENSNITLELGAVLAFYNNTTAETATLTAASGTIYFEELSTGNLARIELTGGGILDLTKHNNASPMTIGSLEGDGISTVRLGTQTLTVGGNGLSTTFSGAITQGGSLVKAGSEKLTLTGSNTYRGGTTITGGTLIAQARTGSATGPGALNVNAGTLGGKGTIAGAVTVGTGTGSGAYFAPGTKGPDTLAISKALTFKADGSYKCDLSLGRAKTDQVSAKGVTIESGAQFVLSPKGVQTLTIGTVFTVINNTAATAISGTFANLADGSIISATAGNKLQVSYEGGDGNDLTLTVVP